MLIAPAAEAERVLATTITVDGDSHARRRDERLARRRHGRRLAQRRLPGPCARWPVIGRTPAGVLGLVRTPAPGDLYKAHLERLDWLNRFSSGFGIRRVTTLAELTDAKAKGEPALMQDSEGCDFLDARSSASARRTVAACA